MTEDDDEHSGHLYIEVPAGRLELTGHPAEVLVEASATAVQSLSDSSIVASSSGYNELATATEVAQVHLQQTFNITGGHVTINQPQTITITQHTISEVHNQVESLASTLEANNIPFFDCKNEFDQCMSAAVNMGEQLHCRVIYFGCLAQRVISTLNPLTE